MSILFYENQVKSRILILDNEISISTQWISDICNYLKVIYLIEVP